MDKCNKCLKMGPVKKLLICAVPGSDFFNFNSELHLCSDCYEDFLQALNFEEYQSKKDKVKYERAFQLYLNNLPDEGKERVFNHFAYGPYIKFKRKKDWLKENEKRKTQSIVNSKHKKTSPKFTKAPPIDENICSEVYWVQGSNGLDLCCPIKGSFNKSFCIDCPYYKTGNRLKESVYTIEQSEKYNKLRAMELFSQKNPENSNNGLKTRPRKRRAGAASSVNNRDKIGSLEFGKVKK